MSIEALKEQARRHEQKEEWQKALDLYEKAIGRLEKDDQPDIGLYNRAGDLQVRIGQVESAVEHYEKAVDLYVEAELPNNAIAVCRKVVRNLPERHSIYLKMGQIRADQGFLTDARQNFLTYAERMQAQGDLDEAFRALEEFAELAADDHEIRLALAGQLEARERPEEAAEQLVRAYLILRRKGEEDEAEQIRAKITELDPTAEIPEPGEEEAAVGGDDGFGGLGDLPGFDPAPSGAGGDAEAVTPDVEAEVEGDFGDLEIGGDEDEAPGDAGLEEAAPEDEEGDFDLGQDEEDDEDAPPLPTLDFDEEAEEGDEEDAEPLPLMEFGDEDEEEPAEEAEEEPEVGELEVEEDVTEEVEEELELTDEEDVAPAAEAREAALEEAASEAAAAPAAEPAAEESPADLRSRGEGLLAEGRTDEAREALERAHVGFAEAGRAREALDTVLLLVQQDPDDAGLCQQAVDYAYRTDDQEALVSAYLGLAGCLQRAGDTERAASLYQQALSLDPANEEARTGLEEAGGAVEEEAAAGGARVQSSEDYVDLGSMILGEEQEKTTRFQVAYEEPSGDEAADFARMLDQFKEKVSENLASDDVKAHHDLGTAYKEMGLLDEAVTEFQQALRASGAHLPTYELLGQCFLEMDQPETAVRTLERALKTDAAVEDEFLGIYYAMARAQEALGNTAEAREFYEKIFALDINFQDVTERLRVLRETA